jgi:F420H(2)-dependent quinone reductase
MTETRPLSRRLQARFMRLVNLPMRVVLALPFRTPLSESLMLAYLTGRRSGKIYRTPLSYVRDSETLLTPGGGRWKLNLVEGRPERLRIGGQDLMATPELVGDPDEIERLLELMVAENSRVLSFTGIRRRSDGRLDRVRIESVARQGFQIVRWHLQPFDRL